MAPRMTAPTAVALTATRGTNMRTQLITLAAGLTLAVTLNYTTGADQVDGDTGLPTCPHAAHLTIFEDGSGACYPNKPTRGELDQFPLTHADGSDYSWDEDTFSWNCATDGNKICGPNWQIWNDYDGHARCYALVEDTTTLNCTDGYIGRT